MQIKKINSALGTEITSVNLPDITEQELRAIRSAFNESHVLIIRNQDLDPAAQIAFTEYFGPVEPHPLRTRDSVQGFPSVLIIENRPGRPGAPNNYWHSDISHAVRPPAASCLHALIIPEGRGDTMFCNMAAAYESLSDGMKTMIQNLKALHSGMKTSIRSQNTNDARKIDPSEIKPPSLHPIVRKHPETGNRSLFVNPHFTIGIEGMSEKEGTTILNLLYDTAIRPENIYRHCWQIGDVILWDNRSVMHYAVLDYTEKMPRKMHRTTAAGEAPLV